LEHFPLTPDYEAARRLMGLSRAGKIRRGEARSSVFDTLHGNAQRRRRETKTPQFKGNRSTVQR
jgi:hypothetical protein